MKNTFLLFALLCVVGCKKETQNTNPCVIVDKLSMASNIDSASIDGRVVKLINQLRAQNNLPALLVNNEINNISNKHVEAMRAGLEPVSHDGINARAEAVRRVFACANVGENLAWGLRTADRVVELWAASESHRANILGDFDFIGVEALPDANGQYYFSTIFAKSEGDLQLGLLVN